MDGKSQAWRDAADKLLEALARENKYLVADMVILFLESAGYGLEDYSALGGVFKRAGKRGMIKQVRKTKNQILWVSNVYGELQSPILKEDTVRLRGFRNYVDGTYKITSERDDKGNLKLERLSNAQD